MVKKAEVISDEDSLSDICSAASDQSDNSCVTENVSDNEIYKLTPQEALEEKLEEAIDGLTQKSSKGRLNCFQSIEKMFTHKYFPEFVNGRTMTIAECIEKGLKKGQKDEKLSAARLSSLFCVQLDMYESAESVCKQFKSTIFSIANNASASLEERSMVNNHQHMICRKMPFNVIIL